MIRKHVKIVLLLGVLCLLALALYACGGSDSAGPLRAEEIAYLSDVQKAEQLRFEWLREYNPERPTLVVIHGETTGKGTEKFSMTLDSEEYTFKTNESTDYVVATGIGYKAQGLDLNLAKYWQNVAGYNVVLFHWERFADEDSDSVLAKVFSVPKMKYVKDDGSFEANAVPKNPLAEVFAALYIKEFSDKPLLRETRWVGNGVGADMIAAAADYMLGYIQSGTLDEKYLPDRMTLCDPYLSISDLHLSGGKTTWGADATQGAMGLTASFLADLDPYMAIETVESKEVVQKDSETTVTYAYDIPKSEKAERGFAEIKKHVAYLELSESYSRSFSSEYKAQKRIALDWYLYSVIGSDDSNNAGGGATIGYPRNLSDYQTYLSYSGFNWGTNETRPMINNRALNNDASTNNASTRGKNFSLSAWTPTTYTKGLRGRAFTMKKESQKSTDSDVHGNATYRMNDYVLTYFRSETFQVSAADTTVVCGYVYLDKNKDGYINDGKSGVKNARLSVTVVANEKTVSTFSVTTDESGFYSFSFKDAVENTEGELVGGYSFSVAHTVTIELEPNSHDYVATPSALTGQYYDLLRGNNFSAYKGTVTLNNYVADSTLVANCLVKPV